MSVVQENNKLIRDAAIKDSSIPNRDAPVLIHFIDEDITHKMFPFKHYLENVISNIYHANVEICCLK